MCVCVGVAPERLVEHHRDLLERAEADLPDRAALALRELRVERDRARLEHAERHRHDHVRAAQPPSRGRFRDRAVDHHASSVALDSVYAVAQANLGVARHRLDQPPVAADRELALSDARVGRLVVRPVVERDPLPLVVVAALGRSGGSRTRPAGGRRPRGPGGRGRPARRRARMPPGRARAEMLAASLSPKLTACANAASFSASVASRSTNASNARMVATSSSMSALRRATPDCSAKVVIGLPIGSWIHEQPRSIGTPARSTVCARPPMRPRPSSSDVVDARVAQRVGEREAGPARADDDDPLRVAGHAGRDGVVPSSYSAVSAANSSRASGPASTEPAPAAAASRSSSRLVRSRMALLGQEVAQRRAQHAVARMVRVRVRRLERDIEEPVVAGRPEGARPPGARCRRGSSPATSPARCCRRATPGRRPRDQAGRGATIVTPSSVTVTRPPPRSP